MAAFRTGTSELANFDIFTQFLNSGLGTASYFGGQPSREFGPFNLGVSNFFDNREPVARADTVTTGAGSAITIDVLANDSDADGDSLSVFVLSGTANGRLETGEGQDLTYTPDPGFTGTDGFSYFVRDGNGGTDVGTARVTVAADLNQAPTAHADSRAVTPGTDARVDVRANDTDPDGDALDVAILDSPDDVDARVGADGRIVVAADTTFQGSDSVTYSVTDAHGASDQTVLELRAATPAASEAATGTPVTVTFGETEGAFAGVRDAVVDTVEAAWAQWSRAFTHDSEIELEMRFAETGSLASARPGTLDTVPDPDGDGEVLQSGVVAELNSGHDPNDSDPDGIITLNTDPDAFTWRSGADAPVAEGTYDGLTVMAHEIGHVLGFTGFDDAADARAGHETAYDTFIAESDDGELVFDGPAASALNDGPVDLGRFDPYHLGDPDALLAASIGKGDVREVSDAELAMLQDMGAPVALHTDDADPVA